MKNIRSGLIILIMISNLGYGQEVFYRDKQNGLNLGFGVANGQYTTSSIYNVSYVISGKYLLYGEFEKSSYHEENIIKAQGKAIGGGFGFISRRSKLPFNARLILGYSSAEVKNVDVSINLYSLTFSLYKNISPDKPVNIVPEIFLNYGIFSASGNSNYRPQSITLDDFSFGFKVNAGYITYGFVSPLMGFAIIINGSETYTVFNLAVAFSYFRKERWLLI